MAKAKAKDKNLGAGFVALVFIVLGIWIYNQATDESSSASPPTTADSAPAKAIDPADSEPVGFDDPGHYNHNDQVPVAKCEENLTCWSDRFLADAETYCKPLIEQHAKHSVKWDDGFMTPMFSRFGWGVDESGDVHSKIRFVGDKVEFQNGFGAFTPMSYVCTFDTSQKKIVDVKVFEGRLDASP